MYFFSAKVFCLSSSDQKVIAEQLKKNVSIL